MSFFSHLIRFECEEDGKAYFADLGSDADGPPSPGTTLKASTSVPGLASASELKTVTMRRV
jgi:hypothetical protein